MYIFNSTLSKSGKRNKLKAGRINASIRALHKGSIRILHKGELQLECGYRFLSIWCRSVSNSSGECIFHC